MNEIIKKMVDRFLGWKLPKDFYPDAGISFKPSKPDSYDEPGWWPVGTNLFTGEQAEHMVKYMLEGSCVNEFNYLAIYENNLLVCDMLKNEAATLRQQVEQLSASNARMAEEAKEAVAVIERMGVGCPAGLLRIVHNPDSSAWLEADRAEARRKALEDAAERSMEDRIKELEAELAAAQKAQAEWAHMVRETEEKLAAANKIIAEGRGQKPVAWENYYSGWFAGNYMDTSISKQTPDELLAFAEANGGEDLVIHSSKPLYATPVLPPDTAELVRENEELRRRLAEKPHCIKPWEI